MPLYQFTLIDIRTRLRFIAYAQENSFINGLTFIILVLLWLRAFGIRGKVTTQRDWGQEFARGFAPRRGGRSERKIKKMNQILSALGQR